MNWRRGQAVRLPSGCRGASSDDIVDGCALVLEALGERAFDPATGPLAFAYLWRRFGPPRSGSDPDKDLARYVLRTPDRQVFLTMYPSAGTLAFNVGYYAVPSLHDEHERPVVAWSRALEQHFIQELCAEHGLDPDQDYPDDVMAPFQVELHERHFDPERRKAAIAIVGEPPTRRSWVTWRDSKRRSKRVRPFDSHEVRWREGPPVVQRVNGALFRALRDLLRPVYVRDVAFSVLGHDARRFAGPPASSFAEAGRGTKVAK